MIDVNEFDDTRGGGTQWNWTEDKLLISAWLNVSTNPVIGADKKGEAFWDRIRNYYKESNLGHIKRGVVAIKKRWQRINEGAQRYGSCYEEAVRKMGSGTNLDNIIAAAHDFHKTKYTKKSNYVRIGKSTAIECLKFFVNDVILIFESEYLRKPNSNDVQRLLKMGEDRDFPGMMVSIDCMHWQWKNCPKAWKRMFMSGHKGVPTILLEAVASTDLWIWHAFFGVAGSNNDINVL